MPSPPRALERIVHLREQVEDRAQMLAVQADARVPHAHHHVGALHAHGQAEQPALGGELRGIAEQVGEHLGQAVRVGVERQRPVRHVHLDVLPGAVQERLHGFLRGGEHVGQRDALDPELEPVAGDPGHVQQVVHQPDQVRHLAVDHVPGLPHLRPLGPAEAEHLDRVADRGERVP
jgi:hypothetical protein